jgi:hypothetical protein
MNDRAKTGWNESLNIHYRDYKAGLFNEKRLESHIFEQVLEHHSDFGVYYDSKDECADFLVWLYPRLSPTIRRYKDRGIGFSGYINSFIRFSFKEFRRTATVHAVTEYSVWREKSLEAQSLEYCGQDETSVTIAPPRILNRRQILMVLLKSYFFVDESLVVKVARAVGMESEKIMGMIDQIRDMRFKRDNRVRVLREKIYSQYYRCVAYERRLRFLAAGSCQWEKGSAMLELARKRLGLMRKRLSAMRLEASNRQIAIVLGVAKGTVDAGLYSFKNHMESGKSKRGRKAKCDTRSIAADKKEESEISRGPDDGQ